MKVLHINSYYSTSNFYYNLYQKQYENNMNIQVYVPVSKEYRNKTLNLGDYAKVSYCYKKYDRLIFSIKHKKIYQDIIKSYQSMDFDIIHAHSLFSNGYISLKLKKKYNIPYIVAVRNTDLNIFFKRMIHLRKLGLEILKEAEKIIFISESYKDQLLTQYIPQTMYDKLEEKSEVIPNGVDDFWLKNKPKSKKITPKSCVQIIYVGVINKNKNIQTTVEAIKILRKRGINTKFTIVGDIKDEKIYSKLNKLDFISFVPRKNKNELLSIYRENHIFIMPSIYETFGLVYVEAMSQGIPIIYSKNQGFDKQFKEGLVGYSVDCYNSDQIANRIIDILNDYEIISEQCINNSNRFSWDKLADRYEKIYINSIY